MSHDGYREQYEAVETVQQAGDHEAAGTRFSLAAYELLGETALRDREEMLTAVATLAEAAICYRIGGHETRCELRYRQGETVVDEIDERHFEQEPYHGLAHELRGDFHLICGTNGHREGYRRARAIYADYEDEPERWQTNAEFELAFGTFLKTAEAVDHQYEQYQPQEECSLLSRLYEKMYHFDDLLQEIEEVEVWSW